MHGLELAGTAHVPRAAAVFVVEQKDEVRMRGEMVEGTLDQLLDGFLRRQPLEVELALLGTDFLVNPFKYREVKRVLIAKIVIDQLLVDAGAAGNVVDPRPGKAAAGKFAPRCGQQFPAGGGGIAPLRPQVVGSSFGHFQPNS